MHRYSALLTIGVVLLLITLAVIEQWNPSSSSMAKSQPASDEPRTEASSNASTFIAQSLADPADAHPSPETRTEEFPGETGILAVTKDAQEKTPLAGVDVYTMDLIELPEHLRMQDITVRNANVVAYVKEHGQRFRSDERGLARLPRLSLKQIVYAEFDGKRDLQQRGALTKVWLSLNRIAPFEVLVIDQSGNPVPHFPVEIQRRTATQFTQDDRAWTNADGIAAFPPFSGEDLEPNYQGLICVAAGVHGVSLDSAPQAWRQLQESDLDAGRITLVKPPTGSLQVEVVDPNPNGPPRSSGSHYVVEIEAPHSPELFGGDYNAIRETRTASGLVPFVGLDSTIVIKRFDLEYRIPGPKIEGEHVHHALHLQRENVWNGQLIGLDGKPVGVGRIRFVEFAIGAEQQDSNYGYFQTDHEGNFQASIRPPSVDGENIRRAIALTWTRKEDDEIYCAQVELGSDGQTEQESESQPHLGSIQLTELPVVLTGTLSDENGLPLADADITEHSGVSSSPIPGSHLALPAEVVEIDDNGEFKIWLSGPKDADYRLVAHADGYVSQRDIAVKVGTPVHITLKKQVTEEAVITGSVKLEPWASSSDFRFLYYREKNPHYRTYLPIPSTNDGLQHFQLEDVPTEPFVILVETRIGEVFFQSKPIPAEAGQTIDLGMVATAEGMQQQVRWEVQDENGLPILAEFEVQTDGFTGTAYSYRGSCTVRTLNAIRAVRVSADGFVTKELAQPDSSQTIVLQREPQ